MEKEFNKKASNTDDDARKNAEDEELSFLESEMLLRAQQESVQLQIEKLNQELEMGREDVECLENSLTHNISQLQTSPPNCSVSPIGSPIYKYENLSVDRFEDLPDSAILDGSFRESDVISSTLECLKAKRNTLENILDTTLKTLANETQAAGSYKSDTRFNSPPSPDWENIEPSARSSRNSGGKGKEAASEIYRYEKRSKTNVSKGESSTENSPVKCTEVLSKPESKAKATRIAPAVKRKSSELSEKYEDNHQWEESCASTSVAKASRISPAVKRKLSELSEKDVDKQQWDESCASTSVTTKLPKSRTDDDELEVTKKLKFESDEKIKRENPFLSALLSEECESTDLAKFMDQPQADQSHNESEEWPLPSTSGLSNVMSLKSSSEESSVASGSDDVVLSDGEREERFLKSITEMLRSERRESSPSSTSEDTSVSGSSGPQ